MRRLGVFMSLLLLGACGEASSSSDTNSAPTATVIPSGTPRSSPLPPGALVPCPDKSQSQPGGIEGIGGTVAQFAVRHPQDPAQPAEFGDGSLPDVYSTACDPSTRRISSIDYSLPRDANGNPMEMSEDAAMALLKSAHVVPGDAVFVSATTVGSCRIVVMKSATLGQDSGASDPSGNYSVELNRPPSDAGPYDPAKVANVLVTLGVSTAC